MLMICGMWTACTFTQNKFPIEPTSVGLAHACPITNRHWNVVTDDRLRGHTLVAPLALIIHTHNFIIIVGKNFRYGHLLTFADVNTIDIGSHSIHHL